MWRSRSFLPYLGLTNRSYVCMFVFTSLHLSRRRVAEYFLPFRLSTPLLFRRFIELR